MAGSPQHLTLSAASVASLTFDSDFSTVEVMNVDGAAAVYVSVDGSTSPTVAGTGFHVVPAAVGAALELPVLTNGNTVVKLISAGTPRVSVRGIGGGA